MKDFKEILDKEIMPGLGGLQGQSPEQMQDFSKLMEGIEKDGALSRKYKELIALAISVKSECSYCISFHVSGAIKAGANRQEIIESTWVAVLMGGGPALMYALEVDKALKDFGI